MCYNLNYNLKKKREITFFIAKSPGGIYFTMGMKILKRERGIRSTYLRESFLLRILRIKLTWFGIEGKIMNGISGTAFPSK